MIGWVLDILLSMPWACYFPQQGSKYIWNICLLLATLDVSNIHYDFHAAPHVSTGRIKAAPRLESFHI